MRDRSTATTETRSAAELRALLLQGTPVTERRIELAGTSTAVIEAGSGSPVVLLHGQGGFGPVFLPIMESLRATHRLVAPDLPGLGASELLGRAPDGALVMSWLSELIDRTCDAPPALVGMSLGGSIAARFAVDHSDRISRLVLVNPGGLGPRPPLRVLLPLMHHGIRPTRKTAQRMKSIVMLHPEREAQVFGERLVRFQSYMLDRARTPSVQRANRRLLRELGLPRIPDADLGRIRTPTSLICSRQDRVMKLPHAEEASRRHGWPLEIIDDAGHVVFVDQRDALLQAWLERSTAREPGGSFLEVAKTSATARRVHDSVKGATAVRSFVAWREHRVGISGALSYNPHGPTPCALPCAVPESHRRRGTRTQCASWHKVLSQRSFVTISTSVQVDEQHRCREMRNVSTFSRCGHFGQDMGPASNFAAPTGFEPVSPP